MRRRGRGKKDVKENEEKLWDAKEEEKQKMQTRRNVEAGTVKKTSLSTSARHTHSILPRSISLLTITPTS